VVVELGCGPRKQSGRIGVDRLALPGVDIVCDLEQGLPFFPDNSVDEIHSTSLLEHVADLEGLMREIWRVLKPTGKKHLFVPHFSNPYYYSDYTHQRFFGLYTLQYFSKSQTYFERKVPDFYHNIDFTVLDVSLEFYSPWMSRGVVKRVAYKLFNLNPWWQEFYEENLCYLIPCYGIRATLQPEKGSLA
jgi:ubiquinone/menaquinone biosynthesis C-methylase UbiE